MSSPLVLKIFLYYLMVAILSFLIYISFKILFPFFKSGLNSFWGTYSKERTVYVKIVSKRIYTFESNDGDNIENYYLSFQDNNKKVIEFLVDDYYYNFYSKGEKGYLTYKGVEFIEFIRKSEKSI